MTEQQPNHEQHQQQPDREDTDPLAIVRHYLAEGWVFHYDHANEVYCRSPEGGYQYICDITNMFNGDSFGRAIAHLLNSAGKLQGESKGEARMPDTRRRVRVNWRMTDVRHDSQDEGWFHGWGMTPDEDVNNPYPVSAAIIEFDSGRVEMVEPDIVRFLDCPESGAGDE